MVTLINWIVATHVLIIVIAIMAWLYLRSPFLQSQVPFKHATYACYSVFIVGLFSMLIGSGSFDVLPTVETGRSFLNTLKSAASEEANYSLLQKDRTSIYHAYILYLIGAASAMGFLYFGFSIWRLYRSQKSGSQFRSVGRIKICVAQDQQMPHVFSIFRYSYIVVPKILIENRTHLRNVIHHETQHIRNLDTSLVFVLSFIKSVFFINPMAHWFARSMRHLHELAVDSEIVSRRSRTEYLSTLSWVFQQTGELSSPHLTNGFFGKNNFKEYVMRISNIKNSTQMKLNVGILGLMVSLGIVGVSCATQISKSNLAVDTLETSEKKEQFAIVLKVKNGKKESTMRVHTQLNEESRIVHSNDPDILNHLDIDLETHPKVGSSNISFKVTKASDDWASVRITGFITQDGGIKQFDIARDYRLGVKNDVKALGMEFTINRKI